MRGARSIAVVLVGVLAAPALTSCSLDGLDPTVAAQQSEATVTSSSATDSTTSPPTSSLPPTSTSMAPPSTIDSTVPPETVPPETAPPETAPPETAPPAPATTPAPVVPADDVLVATIIGDSYSTGSPTADGEIVNWPAFVETGLHDEGIATSFTVAAVGATGYVSGRDSAETFADRVAGAVTARTEVVIVFGSRNDGAALAEAGGADALRAAAAATYSAIRAVAPGATVIVVGPPWVNENVPEPVAGVRDVVRAVATEFGAVFVDPLAAGWFFGDAKRFISADGVHPTGEGQEYMAARLFPIVLDVARGHRLCGSDSRVRPPPCDDRAPAGP